VVKKKKTQRQKGSTNKNVMTSEQRGLQRVPMAHDVEVTFDDYRRFTIEYAENISQGGMYLRTQNPLPANTNLRFRIKIQDIDREIAGSAIVVWTKEVAGSGSGMGLKFVELEGDSAAFIQEFVNRHAVTEK